MCIRDSCQTPELATKITLMPIEQIGPDAAILFSDILVVLQAMQMTVEMRDNIGPWIPNPVRSQSDIDKLIIPNINEHLGYVMEAIKMTKTELNQRVPLIGFAGSPWTLLCYAVQGQGSKNFDKAKAFCFSQTNEAHSLLQKITDTTILYLKEKVACGVNAIQIFDSWANLLSEKEYKKWSLQYIDELIKLLKNDLVTSNIPVILFAREPKCSSSNLIETSADCISLFWTMRTPNLDLMKNKVAIQGNLNPAILLESNEVIKEETYKILDMYKDYPGYIFNLGHGITPNISPDKVKFLTQLVREY